MRDDGGGKGWEKERMVEGLVCVLVGAREKRGRGRREGLIVLGRAWVDVLVVSYG